MAIEGLTFPLAVQMATDEGLMGPEKDQSTASTATLKIAEPTWSLSLFFVSQLSPNLSVISSLLNTSSQYFVSIDFGKSDSDQLLHLKRVSSLED